MGNVYTLETSNILQPQCTISHAGAGLKVSKHHHRNVAFVPVVASWRPSSSPKRVTSKSEPSLPSNHSFIREFSSFTAQSSLFHVHSVYTLYTYTLQVTFQASAFSPTPDLINHALLFTHQNSNRHISTALPFFHDRSSPKQPRPLVFLRNAWSETLG